MRHNNKSRHTVKTKRGRSKATGHESINNVPAAREEREELPVIQLTQYIEQWQSFGKDAYESVKELEAIAAKVADQITAQQIELVNTYVETGVAQFAMLGEPRGYKDILTTQMELASGLQQKFAANARKTAELMNDLRNELTAWYETKLNNAAKAAVKKAPVKKAA